MEKRFTFQKQKQKEAENGFSWTVMWHRTGNANHQRGIIFYRTLAYIRKAQYLLTILSIWKGYKIEKGLLDKYGLYSRATLLLLGSVRDNISSIQRTEAKRGREWVSELSFSNLQNPIRHAYYLREIIICCIRTYITKVQSNPRTSSM